MKFNVINFRLHAKSRESFKDLKLRKQILKEKDKMKQRKDEY